MLLSADGLSALAPAVSPGGDLQVEEAEFSSYDSPEQIDGGTNLFGDVPLNDLFEEVVGDGSVIQLDDSLIESDEIVLEEGDVLTGSGEVDNQVINNGLVSPGNSPGVQNLLSFTQGFSGTTLIEIGGLTPGAGSTNIDDGYDQINITGEADLNGTLEIDLINGFVPSVGDSFQVLTFGSVIGDFASYEGINLGNDLALKPVKSATGISLTVVESSVDRPVLVVPGFGGTLPFDRTETGLQEWYLNRGIHPDKLEVEPLANGYDDLFQTLSNVGYVEGVSVFGAAWDWRMPVAVEDGVADGHLTSHTGASISDTTFESGVDY